MYDKTTVGNNVFLIRYLVNMKMKEGIPMTAHIQFNSILSRLVSVEIKFDDKIHALVLLYSFFESCSGTGTIAVHQELLTLHLKAFTI